VDGKNKKKHKILQPAKSKKGNAADVVTEVSYANALAAESPSCPQNPLPLGMGRFSKPTA